MTNLVPKTGIDKNGRRYTRMISPDALETKRSILSLDGYVKKDTNTNTFLNRLERGEVYKGEVVELSFSSETYDFRKWATGLSLQELSRELGGAVDFNESTNEIVWRIPQSLNDDFGDVEDVKERFESAFGITDPEDYFDVAVTNIEPIKPGDDKFVMADHEILEHVENHTALAHFIGADTDEGQTKLFQHDPTGNYRNNLLNSTEENRTEFNKAFEQLPYEYQSTVPRGAPTPFFKELAIKKFVVDYGRVYSESL